MFVEMVFLEEGGISWYGYPLERTDLRLRITRSESRTGGFLEEC